MNVQFIKKRSGRDELYQTAKILSSMRNAGISYETAQRVVSSINYHEGMTTSEVRSHVIGGIKNREPQAAKLYESHPRRPHAQ